MCGCDCIFKSCGDASRNRWRILQKDEMAKEAICDGQPSAWSRTMGMIGRAQAKDNDEFRIIFMATVSPMNWGWMKSELGLNTSQNHMFIHPKQEHLSYSSKIRTLQ